MGQGVGCTHRQNGQGNRSIYDHLRYVMDGAIAATGEDRIATGRNRFPCLLVSMRTRLGGNHVGFDACTAQHRQRRFQLSQPTPAAAARIRVIEKCGLAHEVIEAGLYLTVGVGPRRPGKAAAEDLPRSPLPHAKHRFLRQRVTKLARDHRDLPAMMRVVRDQVSQESGYIWTKALHPAVALERPADYYA